MKSVPPFPIGSHASRWLGAPTCFLEHLCRITPRKHKQCVHRFLFLPPPFMQRVACDAHCSVPCFIPFSCLRNFSISKYLAPGRHSVHVSKDMFSARPSEVPAWGSREWRRSGGCQCRHGQMALFPSRFFSWSREPFLGETGGSAGSGDCWVVGLSRPIFPLRNACD